ncbi:MAG TPA: histidine phosphatase family protein [Trueperaceae bacterium]
MRRLTLIRHALTDWNSTGKLQGHLDCPLSEEGVTQARALARRVGSSEIDLLYSSPLKRAVDTARLAFPAAEVVTDPRLMELDFGVFQGKSPEENRDNEAWDWWLEDPFSRRVPDGESYSDLMARVVAWLGELPKVPHVVAVTHSGPIQMLIAHVMGVQHPRWRKRIFLRHTSLTRLLFREDQVLIERVNDTRHLKSDFDPFLD